MAFDSLEELLPNPPGSAVVLEARRFAIVPLVACGGLLLVLVMMDSLKELRASIKSGIRRKCGSDLDKQDRRQQSKHTQQSTEKVPSACDVIETRALVASTNNAGQIMDVSNNIESQESCNYQPNESNKYQEVAQYMYDQSMVTDSLPVKPIVGLVDSGGDMNVAEAVMDPMRDSVSGIISAASSCHQLHIYTGDHLQSHRRNSIATTSMTSLVRISSFQVVHGSFKNVSDCLKQPCILTEALIKGNMSYNCIMG